MHLINLMVIYLQRKYGVPLHNFFEKWSSGISYLNAFDGMTHSYVLDQGHEDLFNM